VVARVISNAATMDGVSILSGNGIPVKNHGCCEAVVVCCELDARSARKLWRAA
jgi:hypothetical protein